MTRQEIEEKTIARAWQDTSFKQELLSNPLLVELTEEVEQSIQGGALYSDEDYKRYRRWGRELDKGVAVVRAVLPIAVGIVKKKIFG